MKLVIGLNSGSFIFIRPEQSQIWAVMRANADLDRIMFVLTSAFLGRFCLSGEIFDLNENQWGAVKEAISFYGRVKHIIKDGFTKVIRTNVKDYLKPKGYQAVLRELGNEALLIVHTFEDGANPPIDDLLKGWNIKESLGSELNGSFRGKVFLLSR